MKMSVLLLGLLLFALGAKAIDPDSLVVIRGVVLDDDSIPVENVHLISYTTLLAYATNEKGEFKITTPKTDSLKIVHISYESVIVKPIDSIPIQRIFLKMSTYSLKSVDIRLHDTEIESMDKTFEEIRTELGKEYQYNYQSDFLKNRYAPTKEADGMMEVNFFELYKRIKRKLGK